jgi:PIN domain nuclease of toxin-antitoxin system
LWALTEDAHLTPEARAAIGDGRKLVFVSAVSAWEITIKRALGKLAAPDDLGLQLSR